MHTCPGRTLGQVGPLTANPICGQLEIRLSAHFSTGAFVDAQLLASDSVAFPDVYIIQEKP